MANEAAKTPKFAFQCKNCGALEPPEAAGENAVPSACHVCGHGFKPEMGTHDPDNWIILAELNEKELKRGFARHGLTKAQVTAHTGVGSAPSGRAVEVTATEKIGSKDRG